MTDIELMAEAYEWQKYIKNLVTATDDKLYHKRSKVFDWLIEQSERVQELEEENERLCALNIATTHELNHVDKINKRYREALVFYANEENYKPFDGISLSSYQNKIDEDGGQTARKALESEE